MSRRFTSVAASVEELRPSLPERVCIPQLQLRTAMTVSLNLGPDWKAARSEGFEPTGRSKDPDLKATNTATKQNVVTELETCSQAKRI